MNFADTFKKCGLVSIMPMYVCIYISVYLYIDKSFVKIAVLY